MQTPTPGNLTAGAVAGAASSLEDLESRAACLRQLRDDLRHDLGADDIDAEIARVFANRTHREAFALRTMWQGDARDKRRALPSDLTLRVAVALASAGSLWAAWAAAAHAACIAENQAAAHVAERRAA
jgi:hypothetical protein